MTYQELKRAIELFGLGERATRQQIRSRHRQLVKAHHPDQAEDGNPALMREINRAHEVIVAYCDSYQFCFSEEEFFEQRPQERMKRQFGWI